MLNDILLPAGLAPADAGLIGQRPNGDRLDIAPRIGNLIAKLSKFRCPKMALVTVRPSTPNYELRSNEPCRLRPVPLREVVHHVSQTFFQTNGDRSRRLSLRSELGNFLRELFVRFDDFGPLIDGLGHEQPGSGLGPTPVSGLDRNRVSSVRRCRR